MDEHENCCPNCGKPISGEIVAKITEKSRLSMVLKSNDGHHLEAKDVGKQIQNFAKMIEAIGREEGDKVTSLIESVTGTPTEVSVTVLIVRKVRDK